MQIEFVILDGKTHKSWPTYCRFEPVLSANLFVFMNLVGPTKWNQL